MAVYTSVSDEALAAFLGDYDLGRPLAFKGIAEGVENSNYYLETEQGRFILTLFERRADPKDLPYFMAVKQHLASKGFPCPAPVAARDGEVLRQLEGRPAVIVTFLDGLSPNRPTPAQCRSMGEALARMHAALDDFTQIRENALGPASWPKLWHGREQTAEELQAGLAELITSDLEAVAEARDKSLALPRGTIHADLFPDNTFFIGDDFTGAIDFYFACTDALAYDIAVCLNSWAFEGGTEYNYSKGTALIGGYESVRPLQPAERAALPVLCRGAALRFFLTRLVDWTDTPDEALVKPKNPLDYAARLAFHRKAGSATEYGA
ncbi:homoserine kinase [Henriciella aquimarina]|uniref:homoserine kinase n=1 Tax=Henriciella aquimarina TaxID=545261 RepID=UPI000A047223|nr:homoserine kinase [Henriciella aquimarina]